MSIGDRAIMKRVGEKEVSPGFSMQVWTAAPCGSTGQRRLIVSTGEEKDGWPVWILAEGDSFAQSLCCAADPDRALPRFLILSYNYVSGGCSHYDESQVALIWSDATSQYTGVTGFVPGTVTLSCVAGSWQLSSSWHTTANLGATCPDPFEFDGSVTITGGVCTGNLSPSLSYDNNSAYTFTIIDPATRALNPRGVMLRADGTKVGWPVWVTAGCYPSTAYSTPCCLYDAPDDWLAEITISAGEPHYAFLNGWTFPVTYLPALGYWYGASTRTVCENPATITVKVECQGGRYGPTPNPPANLGTGAAGILVTITTSWIQGGITLFGSLPTTWPMPMCVTPYLYYSGSIRSDFGCSLPTFSFSDFFFTVRAA